MIPNAKVTKADGNTGAVKPSSKGICAIIAPCQSGSQNVPSAHTKASLALAEFGYGELTDDGAYVMSVAGNPVLLIRGTASTAGASSTVAHVGVGTSVVTVTGTPIDDFKAKITIVNPGTIGVSGITLTYTLDDGETVSAVTALGVANTFAVPNSGITFAFAAGTVLAGQTESVTTTGPRMTNADISTALEALRVSAQPWEWLLIGGHDATAASVAIVDSWLSTLETKGRFRGFAMNGRMKTSIETEAAFITAMDTAFSATATIRGCVGADGGSLPSAIPGRAIVQDRRTALALSARLMRINYGVDAAYVQDGPVPGFLLGDAKGNPVRHDENLYPGCDALRLVTLRTFDRKAGTFITNPLVLSTQGSDFVYAQHIRTMNRACELAYDVLTQQLSRGVGKSPVVGPTGQVYIAEEDALEIEQLVDQALNELRGQVSDLRFRLSRTDDIGGNGPITLNGDLEISSLAYAKEFNTNAAFVRTISAQQ